MATTTIDCADCGHQYETARKNTKYCRVCRLLRNLSYLKNTTYTCFVCDKDYAPLERQPADWRMCGTCERREWPHDVKGTCALCNDDSDRLIHADIAVCRKCAFDPEKRPLLVKALARKQRERAGV